MLRCHQHGALKIAVGSGMLTTLVATFKKLDNWKIATHVVVRKVGQSMGDYHAKHMRLCSLRSAIASQTESSTKVKVNEFASARD